ncbi:hypothetical protein LWI29_008050 [Acer saccharum]|uniref:DUF1985 domain-containing protein n=1 Tax=Acer saccharum TaxID=4024 RepID=A0AA39SLW4_ACESA|nr:hypothetical protein LWI29_008050 [Acer saccharum]
MLYNDPKYYVCLVFKQMPPNPNAKLWRFPDHKEWVVNVRVNSQSKKNLITDIKEVLTSCGMVQRFKEGPFGSYLDLPQPSKIHGILIHNLLKREVIIPEQREDEIWLGLGRSQFNKKKAPEEGSLLNRHFKEKRPTTDLLYATMKRLTSDDGEDVLKMASIFMISQFFGTDDGRKAIPGWMFALVDDEEAFKKFPWGSYIYSITLFWLKRFTQKHVHTLRGTTKEEEKKKDAVEKGGKEIKGEDGEEEDGEEENEENEHEDEKKETETETEGQQVNENEESKGQQVYDNKEGGQPPEITEHGKEKKKSKYHTLNIFGFTLAFQEESSDEEQDQNFKLDGVDESMYNHRTTASFVSSPDDPPSKKKLFYHTDFQTHKSTVHTSSPPSTIADLFSAIASLIKESDSKTLSLIKESEERQLSCIRAELNKIREEIKVGDTLGKKSTKENSGTSNQMNDKVSKEDRDAELLFKQAEKNDVEADATCNVTAMEENIGQDEAASKSDGVAFENNSSDPRADAPAVSKMVEDVDNRTILDENELKEINNCVEFCIEEIVQEEKPSTKKSVQQSIVLDDLASPSVVAYDVADPNVMYKDHDKSRARKRTRFLNNQWINPLAKRLKSNVSDKPSTQDEITNVEFAAFMKTKQPTW